MKISLEPYKGVRDFYPEDQALQNYIFKIMRQTAESWSYTEYNASVLEPLELYKEKTSEEIVNEQIYSFKDRGDREVALRPEMTPTAARMVAQRWQDLPSPVRWYSIPNVFRYEKPQRGRLREHWQLNADIFGVESFLADAEIISLSHEIMKKFGAKETDFEIRINSRRIMEDIYESLKIPDGMRQKISRVVDKRDKISPEKFREALQEIDQSAEELAVILESKNGIFENFKDSDSVKDLRQTLDLLWSRGVTNIVFSPTLTRGFDYYTGTVFEVFDTNKENPRSLFGGGRYDNLIKGFSGQAVPAVGFGMGDVTLSDFLQTHDLIPKLRSTTEVWLCVAPDTQMDGVNKLADELRAKGVNAGVDISGRKLETQVKSVEKRNIPFLVVVGPEELQKGMFKVRNTETREEKEGSVEEVAKVIKG